MIHPDTELRYISSRIGYGVFATKPIPMGTITWARDPLDQVLTSERFERLRESHGHLIEKYTYCLASGDRLLLWDFARWMNHSCEANNLSPGLDFEVAIRDIAAGEQFTCDYGALNEDTSFECACESPDCRRTIRPEDFEALADEWDRLLRPSFQRIREVPQPLWKWVTERHSVEAALKDPSLIPSIRRHRHVASDTNGAAVRVEGMT